MMPKPMAGEKRSIYVARAIPAFKAEGFKQKQAVGRAEGFFDTYGGGNKKKASIFKK